MIQNISKSISASVPATVSAAVSASISVKLPHVQIISYELAITVLLNIFLVATFIIFFYFTLGINIEKNVIDTQMVYLSNHLYDTVTVLGPDTYNLLKESVNNMPTVSTEDDEKVNKENIIVKKNSFKTYCIFVTLILAPLGLLMYINRSKLNYFSIVANNMTLLVFIMAIYIIFMAFFSSKYISVNPNLIKLSVLEKLKEHILA
jgi:hypothetical protein